MRPNDLFPIWFWARSFGKITIGSKCRIEPGAILDMREGGRIKAGSKCRIRRGAMLIPYGGDIIIGNDFSLNPYSVLYGQGGLKIGNDVRIAAGCVVIPSNHIFSDANKPIRLQKISKLGIVIEDDVWIGANVTVLDGSHISKGCVIAAGAVVRGRTEPYGIYGGVPAKLIKMRGSDADAIVT
ncbi:acyltransferase [Agrobacterium sp. BA1120]|uniref:acyltransferase n=1 Tax=Agrobacterium sp. BA1120 TaxID=3228927 RepID=UPI003369DC05